MVCKSDRGKTTVMIYPETNGFPEPLTSRRNVPPNHSGMPAIEYSHFKWRENSQVPLKPNALCTSLFQLSQVGVLHLQYFQVEIVPQTFFWWALLCWPCCHGCVSHCSSGCCLWYPRLCSNFLSKSYPPSWAGSFTHGCLRLFPCLWFFWVSYSLCGTAEITALGSLQAFWVLHKAAH